MTNPMEPAERRQITACEARRMALEILHRAETERAAVAQREAERGIDWEDEPKGHE